MLTPRTRNGVKHEPTDEMRETVRRMAMVGIPQHTMTKIVGVSIHTLRKHYATELETGAPLATMEVAQTLFEKATSPELTSPSVTAAIFWLKTRAGWVEPKQTESDDDEEQKNRKLDTIEWQVVDVPTELRVVK